jgi:hypothetical protein
VFRKMQLMRMIPQVDTCRRPKPVEQSLMIIFAEAILTPFRLPKSTIKFRLLLYNVRYEEFGDGLGQKVKWGF